MKIVFNTKRKACVFMILPISLPALKKIWYLQLQSGNVIKLSKRTLKYFVLSKETHVHQYCAIVFISHAKNSCSSINIQEVALQKPAFITNCFLYALRVSTSVDYTYIVYFSFLTLSYRSIFVSDLFVFHFGNVSLCLKVRLVFLLQTVWFNH